MASAIRKAPKPSLGEDKTWPAFEPMLTGGIGDHLIGIAASRQMEVLSGLWLVAGDIHRSHTISQDLGSAEGSFLHGIMHRREGDFGNAKYWFRRVGDHPVFEAIAQQSGGYYQSPQGFVDQCQSAVASGDAGAIGQCIDSQWIEWQALMNFITEQ
ncbi:MAG: hypothetical protein AAFN70_20620 [Planctomycetota bacterium]